MPKLRIYIPVLVAVLSLAVTITSTAADELKIVYNAGVAPLKFEDAASRWFDPFLKTASTQLR